jgi:mono/diheme cytochrome c family protein
MAFIDPAFQVYAANITPDIETGIGAWSNDQLKRAIREGIRPDGSIIGPPMPIPFYRHISDADLDAIVVYLRAQPAVRNRVKKGVYHIPLPPDYGPPVHDVVAPSSSDRVAYGKYLATIAHCMDCHTPRASDGRRVLARLGAGGQVFKGPWGERVSPNLTPDESGLKNWTDKQIEHVLRHGTDADGKRYGPPMAFDWYKNINDEDMGALIAYLRSLPPLPFAGER